MGNRTKILVSMDTELCNRIDASADDRGRNRSTEIVRRLEQSFHQDQQANRWQPFQAAPQEQRESSQGDEAKSKSLNKNEVALIKAFNLLSPPKQLALLSLFTPD